MMDKPLGTKLDSGTILNGLEGFWICPSFKEPFLSRRAKPYSHDSPLFHRRTTHLRAAVQRLVVGRFECQRGRAVRLRVHRVAHFEQCGGAVGVRRRRGSQAQRPREALRRAAPLALREPRVALHLDTLRRRRRRRRRLLRREQEGWG
jgi:hypothetical protein